MDPNKQPVTGVFEPRAVTIREIAREAGVSTATVSRVFNSPEVVSKQTRESVLAVIERNHYVAHGFAAGLASRRSSLLGLIIPTITNSIYASSTQAIQKAAQQAGYTVLVGVSEFSPTLEAKLIHRLLERRVEGLILTGAARAPETYEKMGHNGVPFVITWKLTAEPNRPSVSFDNYKAALAAVDYLISLGHRRLGLVCGRTDLNDRAYDRRRAFEDGLRNAGILPEPSLIYERDFEFVEGRAAMHRMLVHGRRPTAVFCANDIQAIGALYECHEAGLRVPQDISIVGFDDLPIAEYIDPQLTTVRVPAAEMGQRAAETLISSLKTGEPLMPVELPTDLIIRGSTAPPSGR
ncbi:MAG: LacI family DNA-binding transcriptional regulator [Candidatus Binatia bacterium]